MHLIFSIIGSTRPDGECCENCTYIGLIHVFSVVNIRRGPKNSFAPECEA